MNFSEFFKQRYGARIDAIIDGLAAKGGYGDCTDACRSTYWSCLNGCPNPPDPTSCTANCRSALESCLSSCTGSKAEAQTIVAQIETIENEAMAAFREMARV